MRGSSDMRNYDTARGLCRVSIETIYGTACLMLRLATYRWSAVCHPSCTRNGCERSPQAVHRVWLGAGIRVGYGSFPLGIVEYLWRAKQPYNVSVAAETAACAALANPAYLERVRDALVQERGRLMAVLEGVQYLQPYPSSANFILCKVTAACCYPVHARHSAAATL